MEKINNKFQTKYSAIIEAKRLEGFIDDKSLLAVYASSSAKVLPYQVAAARFALRSIFLKGCILCDEASLGKTYEALLVAGQKWYEGKENILVILPPNLLTQWFRKLEQDFSTIPYVFWNNSKTLPDKDGIIITTYDTAIRRAETIKENEWDLVIFDEADVLSKPDNKSVMILKNAVGDAFKLLLTPTPMTLSIMDIYGLIHFIDESVLPDSDWFYKRYFRKPENYHELTDWVSQFCFRTLKAQTTEYVNFSRRLPITIDYPISKAEEQIYKLINAYILSDNKAAYPEMDSYNLNLLFFKTLSSSPQALVKMLNAPISRAYGMEKEVLKEIQKYAGEIYINSKTEHLLKILKTVFNHLKSMKVKQKAVIFAENSTTLDVLYKIFKSEYNTLKYKDVDTLELFRFDDNVQILIATDEAAKGIDLEFCPVAVNYDLPYDTLKMEQRICRCHRLGQTSDVLVINMLSSKNLADVRVLELINKRTLQFNGIFGMSDDIVGNFDTKIKEVLKDFRHRDVVAKAFKDNLTEHREDNEKLVEFTEDVLFSTFTKSIADKVTITPAYIEERVEEINRDLWEIVKYYFQNIRTDCYSVDEENQTLTLQQETRPILFSYKEDRFRKKYEGYKTYGASKDFKPKYGRITFTSRLAKGILKEMDIECAPEGKIYVDADIEPCEIGYYYATITASKKETFVTRHVLVGQTESGRILDEKECIELLNLPVAELETRTSIEMMKSGKLLEDFGVGNLKDKISKEKIISDYLKSQAGSIAFEVEKIKLLAERKKTKLELTLNDLKTEIRNLNNQLTSGFTSQLEKLQATKKLRLLERELLKKDEALFFDKAQIDVDTEKEIAELTNEYNFNVLIGEQFKLQLYKY